MKGAQIFNLILQLGKSLRILTIIFFSLAFSTLSGQQTKFIVTGDSRDYKNNDGINYPILSEIIREANNKNVNFLILTGDQVYEYYYSTGFRIDCAELERRLNALKTYLVTYLNPAIKVYLIRGNHDMDIGDLNCALQAWRNVFGSWLPDDGPTGEEDVTYTLKINNILFIAMDQWIGGFDVQRKRVNQPWLRDQLFNHNPNIYPHVFPITHQPSFEIGTNNANCTVWSGPSNYPDDRNAYWNNLQYNSVKSVFNGDIHIYDHAKISNSDNSGFEVRQFIAGTAVDWDNLRIPDCLTCYCYQTTQGYWQIQNVFRSGAPPSTKSKWGYQLVDVNNRTVTIKWMERSNWDLSVAGVYSEKDPFSYEVPIRQENFTAYNDLAWGKSTVNPQTRNKITIATSPLPHDNNISGLPGVCELIDYATGLPTGVKMQIIGGGYNGGYGGADIGAEPAAGTDAYNYFNGKVNCRGSIQYINTADGNLKIRFGGLKSLPQDKSYEVVFYSNRAAYGWDRASLVTITDILAFINVSSNGTDPTKILPAPIFGGPKDPSSRLPSDNTSLGYVARYIFDPGSDGDAELLISFNGIPAAQYMGKYASAIMLREINTPLLNTKVYMEKNWNLLSVPLQSEDMRKITLFPSATSDAWIYNQGYLKADILEKGKGFWLKYANRDSVNFIGSKFSGLITVKKGWNIIGPFEKNVDGDAIIYNPPNIRESNFWGYNNGYYSASILEKGKGYWIKVSADGTLDLGIGLGKFDSSDFGVYKNEYNYIEISDSEGNSSKLYVTNTEPDLKLNVLPPETPEGVFEIRFASGREIENIEGRGKEVIIKSALYPIKIRSVGQDIRIKDLRDDPRFLHISKDGEETLIANDLLKTFIIMEDKTTGIPSEYILYQNYPNPFNHSTMINFALPERTNVLLKVYDSIGKEIIKLVDREYESGYHEVEFDTGKMASGTYFYELITSSFTKTRKMLLVK